MDPGAASRVFRYIGGQEDRCAAVEMMGLESTGSQVYFTRVDVYK